MEKKIGEEERRRNTVMELPEGCISHIISLTTPIDACSSLSLVSKSFCSAADSDAVWNHFFPSDLDSIISNSESASSLLSACQSKKSLYRALCDHPIIIDNGKKSFQLDKRTGKKLYMLAARDLSICWGDTPQYWKWTTLPESRFQEVAGLDSVCWFDIRGKISTIALSPTTQYAAFLVFKMINPYGFDYCPAELSVGIHGSENSTKNVCLDPDLVENQLDDNFRGLERPHVRSDGFLEIEMGEFYNSGEEDEEVDMRVSETESNWWKHGFVLEGIEIRLKTERCLL